MGGGRGANQILGDINYILENKKREEATIFQSNIVGKNLVWFKNSK